MSCMLLEGPFYQCCCQCTEHVPVHFHCCTEPKPDPDTHEGRCCCGVRKGYACIVFAREKGGRVHDNWGEHSVGCEMFTPRNVQAHKRYHQLRNA